MTALIARIINLFAEEWTEQNRSRPVSFHETRGNMGRHVFRIISDEAARSIAGTRFHLAQFIRENLYRFVPTDGFKAARPALARALHRPLDAIRIIKRLKSCLTSRAQRAAIYRMPRIAFDLIRFMLASAHDYAAPCPAHRAGGSLPVIQPRHVLVIWNQCRNQRVFRVPARRKHSRASRAHACQNYELATFHSPPTNDGRCSNPRSRAERG